MPESLRIPVWSVDPRYDKDAPWFPRSLANPATYLLQALCYDSLAAPTPRPDLNGISSPNFEAMEPRLAEEWGQTGETSWWVRLKEGVTSHWGNELTAESVKWGFDRAFALGNVASWRWGQVAGIPDADAVEVIDKYTVGYRLRAPNPHFPSFLFFATPVVADAVEISRHASTVDPWAEEWWSRNVAGFGSHAVVEHNERRLRLRARPEYWDGEVPIQEISLELVDSRAEALRVLDLPEPVMLFGLRSDEILAVRDKPNVELVSSWAGHTSLEIGYHRPPFDDIRVRHALSYATPYEEVLERGFLGMARPWRSGVKTFASWYTEEGWPYETDVARARRLMEKAGYRDGFSTLLYVQQRPDMLRVAEILQAAYAEIGIDAQLENLDEAPPAWMPPLHLRTECSHIMTEPLYDLAHDYAAINPILPAPGGSVGVCQWRPRYVGNRETEDMYRDTLTAETAELRRERCVALQKHVVEFAPNVFLAELPEVHATNKHAHAWARHYRNRMVQLTLWADSNTFYLPPA